MKEIANSALAMQTTEDLEAELLKALSASEDASRAKAAFMANMSHELRTPLNAILGVSSLLLLDECLTQEQEESVGIIRSSGETLLSLINDILDFSNIEKGMTKIDDQPFDLRSCIEESLQSSTSNAAEKGLSISYTIDEFTPNVISGDRTRLRQVLRNLLNNAIKFTERGEVLISVFSEPHGNLCEIHFAIKDTGIGIPPERMGRLFKSFSQVDDSITRKYAGAGLGLAISKKLVALMGGRIWAESDLGSGSTFHFTIKAESVFHDVASLQSSPVMKGDRIVSVHFVEQDSGLLEIGSEYCCVTTDKPKCDQNVAENQNVARNLRS